MENHISEAGQVITDTPRKISSINEPEKIEYIFKEYIGKRPLFIKGNPGVQVDILTTPTQHDSHIVFKPQTAYEFTDKFTLYVTLKRHMEVKCSLIREGEKSTEALVESIDLAAQPRSGKRVDVRNQSVYGHHFLLSNNKIDINPMSYSISSQVIFHDFEKKMAVDFPGIKIYDLDPSSARAEKKIVKKFQKGFIWNVAGAADGLDNDDLIPLNEGLGSEYDTVLDELRADGAQSWLVRPIFYLNLSGERFPVGYFSIRSNSEILNESLYESLGEWETKIIERIMDANTVLINEKEEIWNISEHGVLMKVTNEELKEYIMQRREFTFDLLFRYQAGLRFHAMVTHVLQTTDGHLLVGVAFNGLVYSGVYQGPRSQKILQETLKYLVDHGAPVY